MRGDVEVRRNGGLLIVRTRLGLRNRKGKVQEAYSYTVEIRNKDGLWVQSENNPFDSIIKARIEADRLALLHTPQDSLRTLPLSMLEDIYANTASKVKKLVKKQDRIQAEIHRRKEKT